jgi:hypothetical protein
MIYPIFLFWNDSSMSMICYLLLDEWVLRELLNFGRFGIFHAFLPVLLEKREILELREVY